MEQLKKSPDTGEKKISSIDHQSKEEKRNETNGKHIIPSISDNVKRKKKVYVTDVFNKIKDSLDIRQVLEVYGVSVNSKKFATCPFHNENKPSLKIYSETNSWYCFSCGSGGTAIDFTMKNFNLTSMEAIEKLSKDFNLNILKNKLAPNISISKIRADKKLISAFEQWENQAFIILSSYFRAIKYFGKQIFINQNGYFNKYLQDVENIVFVEYILDLMINNMNDFEKRLEFYEIYGEAVNIIEQKVYA